MASGAWYSEPIGDPLDTLYGASDAYTTAGLSARLCFPIARQINRGRRYADAFYGSIDYKAQFYSNAVVTERALSYAVSRPSYNGRHFFVEHDIGATLTFGCTKSYNFSQMNSLSVLWNVWAKRLQVNLSSGL
jgi:pantothenate kinase